MTPFRPRAALLALLATVAACALAACGGGDASEVAGVVAVADPSPPPPAGAIVEVDLTDLPAGFEAIPFFHDVPGLLRDLDDEILGALGERARLPGQSAGQGFASADSGELAFVITITLDTAADAQRVIRYLTTLPAEGILGFISPDETLFENEQRRDPAVGDAAVQYFLRYGVEEDGRRPRDVSTDLLVFAEGGSVVFVLRSLNSAAAIGTGGAALDIVGLGRALSERIATAIEAAAAASG